MLVWPGSGSKRVVFHFVSLAFAGLRARSSLILAWRKSRAQLDTNAVAPIFNRLYRGFSTRWPHDLPRAADCKSAIQQIINLRYAIGIRAAWRLCEIAPRKSAAGRGRNRLGGEGCG